MAEAQGRTSEMEVSMPKRIDVTRLTPLRRGFLVGYRRARAKARKEMHALAADYDAELVALRDEFDELALAHHRRCIDAATDEALIERGRRSQCSV